MAETVTNTLEKALSVNLDPLKYGTIVEIGAGQEIARWFFRAGSAAGTIAKTMSAYDMNFSDEIYGAVSDRRYVSRARLERMLEQEFQLIIDRIQDHRPEGTRFFACANTVAAQGFQKRDECHGWIGVRLQAAHDMPPDDIILHVRMLDDTNIEQQDALGILGVNLIYGAYTYADQPERLLRSLMDTLKWGRVEIDLIEFRGPTLGSVDNRLMALELVKASVTPAVLFAPNGKVVIPADALYNRSVLAMRGSFKPVTQEDRDRFDDAKTRFIAQPDIDPDRTLYLAEITMSQLANEGEVDTADFLSRIQRLTAMGFHVLISEFFRYFRVRQYLARYSRKPAAIVTDVDGFGDIFDEKIYEGLDGGILEALGKLFPHNTTAYVYPRPDGEDGVSLDDLPIAEYLRPLVSFLHERGMVVPVADYDPPRVDDQADSIAAADRSL